MRAAPGLLLALLVGVAGCDGGVGGRGGAFRIALAGPMDASYGQAVRAGAELAVEQVNARGGIDGRPVELVVHDDAGDEARAIEVAQRIAGTEDIVAVVGHVNSGTSREAARVYNEAARPLLQISPTATSPELSEAGDWTFRVCATDLRHGPALAAWAHAGLRLRRAAVLYANDDYGRGIMRSFVDAFRGAGGSIVTADPYLAALLDSVPMLDAYVERAIGLGAQLVMVAGEADAALPALRLMRDAEFGGPLLGGDGLLGMETEVPDARGVYISTGFLPDRADADAQRFVEAYRARFGAMPSGDAALAYDATSIVLQALADGARSRKQVRDYVAGIGSERPAWTGVTGAIAFDANGDAVDKETAIGTIRDGRLVSVRR